ncbi:hypothetical protein JX265_011147 [Neoarthrinium moseri]|uniref:Zn(2)-C6 fungal-type domain-containing protein n=1 Tax=Neoarthrinium moseri TaxID=1658444 RepID=A0A9P9WCX2_9PEZI|nr:hypothetical protein JX266_002690 [Neoarthrinium moseri]KAI1857732.1 hypothetical protein JX265_011147 [Neoarthrinium moseri]
MRTDIPIIVRPSKLRKIDISIQLKHMPVIGPPLANEKRRSRNQPKMATRLKTDRHLALPMRDDSTSARSRSVSDRSDRSDDSSDHPETSGTSTREPSSRLTRRRASKPKVRTGCKKCENLGAICEGYAPPKTARQISRAERPLLPRPQLASLAVQSADSPLQPLRNQPPLLISPGCGFELAEDDAWYFSLFRNQVAYDLSQQHQQNNFWTRSCLRDAVTMKTIRHSILSIGAYARALMDLKNDWPLLQDADRPWWPASVFNRHREAAFSHHDQALSCLREEIQTHGIDHRSTMAATLLFIVFENMTGNYHASGNLVRSGIKVLNNMGRTQSRSFVWRTYCETFEAPDEIDEMAHMFSRHSIASVLMPFPHGKSAYHMLLDDDDALSDNEENLITDYSTRSTVLHSLEHAQAVWETILPALGRFYAKALWRNLNPNYEVDTDAIDEQISFLARLQEFGAGIAVLDAVGHDETKVRQLNFLAMHHLVATILVSCCLDRTELSYDDFTPQFQEVIAKIRLYISLESHTNKTGFSNEVGVLPLVTFIAAKCRVHSIRLEALGIMRSLRSREGPWDGISLANAMAHLMQLEGQGDSQDGSGLMPPLEARYVWTNMFWDFENRRMCMQYTKVWSNGSGDLEKINRVVSG